MARGKAALMRRPVTAKEKAFILDNYDRMTAKEIAAHLNRSANTVHCLLRNLGCAKPKTTSSDSKPPTDREVDFIRAHAHVAARPDCL